MDTNRVPEGWNKQVGGLEKSGSHTNITIKTKHISYTMTLWDLTMAMKALMRHNPAKQDPRIHSVYIYICIYTTKVYIHIRCKCSTANMPWIHSTFNQQREQGSKLQRHLAPECFMLHKLKYCIYCLKKWKFRLLKTKMELETGPKKKIPNLESFPSFCYLKHLHGQHLGLTGQPSFPSNRDISPPSDALGGKSRVCVLYYAQKSL